MLDTVLKFIVCVLAIYGALSLAVSILSLIPVKIINVKGKIRMVLMVKDSEEVIEGVVRNVFASDAVREFSTDGKLTVVDLGSRDGTIDILNRLKESYVGMEVLDNNDKERVFTTFD